MIFLVPFAKENGIAQGPHAILAVRNLDGTYHPKIAEVPVNENDADATATNMANGMEGYKNYAVLGGDHAVTLGVLRARARTEGPIHLVMFDAHSDEYDYLGNEFVDAGNWISYARKENLLSGITWFNYREVLEDDPEWHMSTAGGLDEIPKTGPVHVTVDFDVLCPYQAGWAVTYPVLGGATTEELVGDIMDLPLEKNDVTVDLTEYDPLRDVGWIGARVAALIFDALLSHLSSDTST